MAKQSKAAAKKAAPKKTASKATGKKPAPSKTASSGKTAPSKSAIDQGKLHGKTVAFVGKFGYKDMHLRIHEPLVLAHGGTIVKADSKSIDYLFAGEGRGGNPPGDVAKIQKRLPAVQVMDLSSFPSFILPSPAELIREIQRAKRENYQFWEAFRDVCIRTNSTIDLTNSKLRGLKLFAAHLDSVDLTGSDLRDVDAEYIHFGKLDSVKFDTAALKHAHFGEVHQCTFGQTDLRQAWFFYDSRMHHGATNRPNMLVKGCDFTKANLEQARIERGKFEDCQFSETSLNESKADRSEFQRCDFSKAKMRRFNGKSTRFSAATFQGADLSNADFRDASLVGANFQNANLTGAVFSDADFSRANIKGADFSGAVLHGAKFDGVDLSQAKNLTIPPQRKAGPKLQELAIAVAGSKKFQTSARVDFSKKEFGQLELDYSETSGKPYIRYDSSYHRNDEDVRDWGHSQTFADAMLELSERWLNGTLRFDTIQASGCKTLRGQKLLELVTEAWAETFGVAAASADDLEKQRSQHTADALHEREQLLAKIRKSGAKVWNDLHYQVRDKIELEGIDLGGANLDKICFWGRKIKKANLAGASLIGGELWNCELQSTDLSNANLEDSDLKASILNGTKLIKANLKNADFSMAKLQGADFTDAILDEAKFDKAQFDHKTIWPKGFKATSEMIWKGDGPAPHVVKKVIPAAKVGSLDFDTFLKDLGAKVEAARMDKAGSMLKAERFQLFAEVKDTGIVGIVKSQSSGDLVYSCRLNADGAFGCCTQNLRPCGGLRGALCKHLLVLIVGLAKAGQLDPATVNLWVDLSGGQKPAIDEESMSATFLRYKGAESGELDWRPTETIPEDFYAM